MGFTERTNQIMAILGKQGSIQVSQLETLLQVSPVTIRKDLQRLEDMGKLMRTHGGAALPGPRIPRDPRTDAMEAIAEKAAAQVEEGDWVILNAGNTTLLTARKLADKRITIITNSIPIARELADREKIKLIFLGGEINPEGGFTYGWDAVTQLEQYKANKLILSVSGLSAGAGLTTRHMEAADLLRKMVQRTQTVIAVADDTKIGFESFCHVCDLGKVDLLLTNPTPATESQLETLGQRNIRILRCE